MEVVCYLEALLLFFEALNRIGLRGGIKVFKSYILKIRLDKNSADGGLFMTLGECILQACCESVLKVLTYAAAKG